MTNDMISPPRPPDAHYVRSADVHRQIEALYPRVEEYAAHFRAMMPVDRSLPTPPGKTPAVRLDPVVCSLAIKAATTKRAVFALSELSDGDNALALTRVLLENACLLEWLIRDEGRRRLEAYVMFMSVQHERHAAMIDRHRNRFVAAGATPEIASDPYHRAVWAHTFRDTKARPTKSHRPTWEFDRASGSGVAVSVHDLFREVALEDASYEHDVLYGALGSDIVHSGPMSLFSIQRQMGDRQTFALRPMPVPDTRTIALASSNVAMLLVLESFTEYVGLDLSAELALVKAESMVDPGDINDEAPK
jgi:hypothetical protein